MECSVTAQVGGVAPYHQVTPEINTDKYTTFSPLVQNYRSTKLKSQMIFKLSETFLLPQRFFLCLWPSLTGSLHF
jgi:hypothetical protein